MTLLVKLNEGLTLDLNQLPAEVDLSCDCGTCEGCNWLRSESDRLAFEAEQREQASRDFDTAAFNRVFEILVEQQAVMANRFLHSVPGVEKELARIEVEQLPFLQSGLKRLQRLAMHPPVERNSI